MHEFAEHSVDELVFLFLALQLSSPNLLHSPFKIVSIQNACMYSTY